MTITRCKSELAQRMSDKSPFSPGQCAAAIDVLINVIRDSLVQREEVYLHGLGTFKVKDYAARTGRNPQTGKPVAIPARTKAVFTPAKHLKDI